MNTVSNVRQYRGKRVDTGQWVYGYLIGNDVIVGEVVELTEDYFNTEWWCRVDPETVGQCTGLPDRYGNDIYEGDIVWDVYYEEHHEVVWDEGCFRYSNERVTQELFERCDQLEVISNIYDRPYLVRAQ